MYLELYCTNPALLFMDQCSVVHVLLEFISRKYWRLEWKSKVPFAMSYSYIFLWFYCRNVGEWNWGSCWSWQPSGLFYRRHCTIACGNLRQGLQNIWTGRHNTDRSFVKHGTKSMCCISLKRVASCFIEIYTTKEHIQTIEQK